MEGTGEEAFRPRGAGESSVLPRPRPFPRPGWRSRGEWRKQSGAETRRDVADRVCGVEDWVWEGGRGGRAECVCSMLRVGRGDGGKTGAKVSVRSIESRCGGNVGGGESSESSVSCTPSALARPQPARFAASSIACCTVG